MDLKKIQIRYQSKRLGGGVALLRASCPEYGVVVVVVPPDQTLAGDMMLDELRKQVTIDDSVTIDHLPLETLE